MEKKDDFVNNILKLAKDKTLFQKSPNELKKIRTRLLRKSLIYFSKKNPTYYKPLLKNLKIDPKKAELKDIVKLATPSDLFRGDLNKKILAVSPKKCKVFKSSGTTNNPVKVYKSTIDEQVNNAAIPNYVRSTLGFDPAGHHLLMLTAPNLVNSIALFENSKKYYASMGVTIHFGMRKLNKEKTTSKSLPKLKLDENKLKEFISFKGKKIIFGAPSGIQILLKYLQKNNLKLDLGKNGYINTGGGTKGTKLMTFQEMQKIAKKRIKADGRHAKWYDGIGHTEGILIMLAETKNQWIPHPLEEVVVVNNKGQVLEKGKGMAIHYNPLNTTFFEAFIPGDKYQVQPSKNYYGKKFKFCGRLMLGEVMRPGCAAATEIQEEKCNKRTKNIIRLTELNKFANNNSLKKELRKISLDVKLKAIQEVANLWKTKGLSKCKNIAKKLVLTSGYSQETIMFELNDIPAYLDSRSLRNVMEVSFNKRELIKPRGTIFVIGSGNTLAPALYSLIYALLTNNLCIIRSSKANILGLQSILDSFKEAEKNVKNTKIKHALKIMRQSSLIIDLPHNHPDYISLLKKGKFDLVHFWGGKKARDFIKPIIKQNKNKPKLLINGPKIGLAIIDEKENISTMAEELAFNMSIFEQKLCSSPTQTYFIGKYNKAIKFAKDLSKHLDKYNLMYPHKQGDSSYKTQLFRNEIIKSGSAQLFKPKNDDPDYTVVVSNKKPVTEMLSRDYFKLHAQARSKYMEIVVVSSLDQAVKDLKKIPGNRCYQGVEGISTIGYGLDPIKAKKLIGLAHRVVPICGIFGRSDQEPSDGKYITREYSLAKKRKKVSLRTGEMVVMVGKNGLISHTLLFQNKTVFLIWLEGNGEETLWSNSMF